MFVAMAVQKKAEIDLFGKPTPIELSFADGMIGVLPVFDTKEAAEKWADGLQVIEVQEALKEKNNGNPT